MLEDDVRRNQELVYLAIALWLQRPPQDNKRNTARRTARSVAQRKPLQQPPPQGKATSILQVNIDGWRGKNTVLNKILDELKPEVVVLQETKLKKKTEVPKVPNYTAITDERKVHRTQASKLPQGDRSTTR